MVLWTIVKTETHNITGDGNCEVKKPLNSLYRLRKLIM